VGILGAQTNVSGRFGADRRASAAGVVFLLSAAGGIAQVVYQVANSLAKIFGLGDIQHAILRDAINQTFVAAGFAPTNKDSWQRPAPNFSAVWAILKHMEEEIGGNVRNLNLRVQPLFETGVFPENPDPRGFEAILGETHVLRLSNLATPELMVAVSRFALQKLYADMLAKGPTHEMRVLCRR
jgi:hypothetical protein